MIRNSDKLVASNRIYEVGNWRCRVEYPVFDVFVGISIQYKLRTPWTSLKLIKAENAVEVDAAIDEILDILCEAPYCCTSDRINSKLAQYLLNEIKERVCNQNQN